MGTWSQRQSSFKGTAPRIVDPYEDWEYATRPDLPDLDMWQPVYIRLKKSDCDCTTQPCPHPDRKCFSKNARALLAAFQTQPDALAMGSDSLRILHRLIAREDDGKPAGPLKYLFIYRPEQASYTPLTDAGDDIYAVRHVGPAVPASSVADNHRRTGNSSTANSRPKRPDIVVTAVIDDAIGIAHDRFRKDPTQTRIHRFWMQSAEAFDTARGGGATAAIGQEFKARQIDRLLAKAKSEDNFYRLLRKDTQLNARPATSSTNAGGRFSELGYRRPIGMLETHGTHVMDIAGGRPIGSAETQDRPLVAVEIPAFATLDTSGGRLPSFVLQGVQRILDWADRWPDPGGEGKVRVSVVINFSYGISAGPKDGSGFLEREIARLVDARNAEGLPTKIVMPAGNNYRDQLTAGFQVPWQDSRSFDWCVIPTDHSVSYLELRVPQASAFRLTLDTPNGDKAVVDVTAQTKSGLHEWTESGTKLGAIYLQPSPSVGGLTRITIALAPTVSFDPGRTRAPAGAYMVTIANTATGTDEPALDVDVDVQRDDTPSGYPIYGRQSYLDDAGVRAVDPILKSYDMPDASSAISRAQTMSALSTSGSDNVFAIGGTYPDDNSLTNTDPGAKQPALYTASGPTRGADPHDPALAAITEEGRALFGVLAAGTYSGSVAEVSGTSAAAPQITRGMVDILVANPLATRDEIIQGLLTAPLVASSDRRVGLGVLAKPYQAEQRPVRRPY